MPLERLTMLVVPVDAGATLVVPRLEAPRVVEHPGVFAIRPWSEQEDPVDIVARLVGVRRQARGFGPDLGDLCAGPAAPPAGLGLAALIGGDRTPAGRQRRRRDRGPRRRVGGRRPGGDPTAGRGDSA